MNIKNNMYDVIIIGAGSAGLFTALSLAPKKVLVLSAFPLGTQASSVWAQGGIAAAVGADDTPDKHLADSLTAGAGIVDEDVTRKLVSDAPAYMRLLEEYGVQFDKNEDGSFALNREACHSTRRVMRATGDGFGAELMRALVVAAKQADHIDIVEDVTAERLIKQDKRVIGAETNKGAFYGQHTVLTTGGLGGLYACTTNPLGSVGRGIALAARAGAQLADLEFVQFHPTALDIGIDPAPLATEALRGDGARLVNDKGIYFMSSYHGKADLAPRDEVSRAIFAEQLKGRKVSLDCRSIENIDHFQKLLGACQIAGLDPRTELIPVKPAVHYHMGGIATDDLGRTSVKGLWACGEVAATGLHGANRLASNSLMEAIVMGGRAARAILSGPLPPQGISEIERVPAYQRSVYTSVANTKAGTQKKQDEKTRMRIRTIMDQNVGVIRNKAGLEQAVAELHEIENKARDGALADMALIGRLIAQSALMRTESRGGHCRADYPKPRMEWEHRSFVTLDMMNKILSKKLYKSGSRGRAQHGAVAAT